MTQSKELKFSFFLYFSVFLLALLAMPAKTNADTVTTGMNSVLYNNQLFNLAGETTDLQKSLAAMPPSLIFSAPNVTQPYLGSEPSQTYQGRGYYFPQELYTEDEVLAFVGQKKDIIQSFGKLYDVPIKGEPIITLANRPSNHVDMGGVIFTGPPNGMPSETIQRAMAYAYYKYGSQKMLIKVASLNYNLSSVGHSGGSLGTGTVQGEFSSSAGISPSTAVTASTVYKTPVVEITCYSNRTTFNLLTSSRQLNIKSLSDEFSEEQLAIIDYNAKLLERELVEGKTLEVLAFSPTGNPADIEKLEPIVREVMNMIGSRLYTAGKSEKFLNTAIKARVLSIKNQNIGESLRQDNAIAGIVLNVN